MAKLYMSTNAIKGASSLIGTLRSVSPKPFDSMVIFMKMDRKSRSRELEVAVKVGTSSCTCSFPRTQTSILDIINENSRNVYWEFQCSWKIGLLAGNGLLWHDSFQRSQQFFLLNYYFNRAGHGSDF